MDRRSFPLVSVLTALTLGIAFGEAQAVDDDHIEIPIAPPEVIIDPGQALVIAEPFPSGVLVKTPDRLTIFLRRFEFDLLPSTLEVFVDGVEVTESLRFWLDRAWMDTPPGFWTGRSR